MTEIERRTRVFISYSRKDLAFVQRVCDVLIAHKVDAFLDKHDIAPGEPWRERLRALILAADVVVFAVSPDSISSSICDWEVNEAERLSKRLLPVIVRPTDTSDIPGRLNRLNFLYLTDTQHLEIKINLLIAAIDVDIGWMRESTRLIELTERWVSSGNIDSRLLRGHDIDLAEQWIISRPLSAPEINENVAEFISTSRQCARKRQRNVVLVSALTVIVSILLAGAAWLQRNVALEQRDQALIAQSRYLSDQSQEHTQSGDAGTAVLLALAALPNGDLSCPMERPLVPEASLALYAAVHASREIMTLVHDADTPTATTGSQSVTGMARVGNGKPVYHAQFSPDGSSLLTVSADGTARLYKVHDKTVRKLLVAQPSSFPFHGDFSADGRYVVVGDVSGGIHVFNASTGALVAGLKGHKSAVQRVRFDDTKGFIVSSSSDFTVKIWNLSDGKLKLVRSIDSHKGPVYEVSFSRDGTRVISASRDSTAHITDIGTGDEIELRGHGPGAVFHAEFSPDGTFAVTASEDGNARLYNAATGELLALMDGHRAGVSHVEFSSDGSLLVTAARDGDARLWRMEKKNTVRLIAILRGHNDRIYHAAFAPDGSRVVTASGDHSVRLWHVPTGEVKEDQLIRTAEVLLRGHRDWVYHAIFDPTGKLVVSTSEDGTARVWSVNGSKSILRLADHQMQLAGLATDHSGQLLVSVSRNGKLHIANTQSGEGYWLNADESMDGSTAVDIDAKASLIALASQYGEIEVWDRQSQQRLWREKRHDDFITSVKFVDSGRLVLSTSFDGTARLSDAVNGETIRTFHGHSGWVWGADIAPDDNRFVTWSLDSTIRIWRLSSSSNEVVINACKGSVTYATYNNKGTILAATCIDGEIGLWNSETGELIVKHKSETPKAARSLAFSPDDKLLAIAYDDGKAYLRSAPDWANIGSLDGSRAELTDVRFSSDGDYVATASQDGTVRLWRSKDQSLHAVLSGYPSGVGQIRFVNSSRAVAAISNQIVSSHVFFDSLQNLITYAQHVIISRELTEDDRQKYGLVGTLQCR